MAVPFCTPAASMFERSPLSAVLAACLGAAACSTDTSALERRSPTERSSGGAGGAAPSAGASGADGSATAGAGGATPAPSGPGALTIVHGLVDGGSLFACLSDRESGDPLGDGTVQPAGGLPYGETLEVPTSWDVSSADVEVLLFVAVSSMWSGVSCAELTAAVPAPIIGASPDAAVADAGAEAPFPLEPTLPRAAGSARFAPGVLRPGARYALIATGCTSPGAVGHEDACGAPDALFGEFQALVVAELADGPAPGAEQLGLQFVNASRAVARADLALQSEGGQASAPLGSDVQFGSVRPLQAAIVAAPIGVELHVQRERLSSYTQAWADTVEGVGGAAAALGHGHLLAYVGPQPSVRIPGLAPPRFVLVSGR